VCPHHGDGGKSDGKKEASAGFFLFIGEGERGGYVGPTRRRQLADGSPERLDCGMYRVPCAWVADWWALVSVFKTGASSIRTHAALFMHPAR
jgi:hypothetical protein